MKKLFRLFLFLALLVGGQQSAVGQETNRGFFVPSSGDCGSISNPVTNGAGCLQTVTANGRDAGTIYVYKGSVTGWQAITAGTGSVTSISTTAPLTGGPITTTGTIAIPATTSKVDGYLSSTDWTTFNAKESALTFSSPLTRSTNTIGCQTASASLAGCLSTGDWTTFNAKQAAGNYVTALTGDVTASGPGSVAATIANAAVTYAKIQNVTDARLLGRSAGSAGAPQEITVGTGLSLSGGSLTATGQAAGNYITALTGDVTAAGPGSVAATIANSAVTYAKIQNVTDARLLGRSAGTTGAPQEITVGTGLSLAAGALTATGQAAGNYITALTGDVTASGPGSVATTIANSAVTLAKIANASANSKLLGSGASGSGAAYSELTLGTNLSMSGTTLNAGGGTLGIWLPDAPPASAGALDTEFGDTTGGTPSGWTETDFPGLLTVTEDSTGANLTFAAASSGINISGIYKTIPAGDFTVWTKVSGLAINLNYFAGGLALWQDATSSSGDIELFSIQWQGNDSNIQLQITRFADYHTFTSRPFDLTRQIATGIYLRIRYTASTTTWSFDYSTDGIGWWHAYTTSALGFTPTHVGIAADMEQTGQGALWRSAFFRSVASNVGVTGTMSGARK